MQIRTALLSDVGKVRGNNEDAVGEDRKLGLLVLADGMGGYQAGEVASQLAVARTLEFVRQHHSPAATFDELSSLLRSAVEQANRAIFESAREHPQYQGMGTTVVACIAGTARFAIAYAGDSRLYRLRNQKLQQITRDHSLVQELVNHGHYTPEEAHRMVSKNIVTRALGVEAQVEVDLLEMDARPDDILLMCSDGLTDMLDDAALREILLHCEENVAAAAIELISEANARGGRDNVSVILARIESA